MRAIEDAAYPSSPPPPNSSPENKKRRIILLAVKNSGRVRLHKARENNDGTFSIGKTWPLEDLSAIHAYDAFIPQSPAEQQQKQWASNVGFTVTIGKSYYWQTATAKEKDFFIRSIVKVYRRYTGGKMPTLIGVSDQPGPGQGPSPPSMPPSVPPSMPPPRGVPPPPAVRMSSQEFIRGRPSEDRGPRIQRSHDRMPRPSEDRIPRIQKSYDQMQRPSEDRPPPRPQKSLDQMQRSPAGPPPKMMPPSVGLQQAQPTFPMDKRVPPPVRPAEPPFAESRVQERPMMPFEAKAPGPLPRPRLYGHFGNDSQASLRSYSSREGKTLQEAKPEPRPEPRPIYRAQESFASAGSSEFRRGKEGSREGTPQSTSFDNFALGSSPASSTQRTMPSDGGLVPGYNNATHNGPSHRNSALLPPTLRPGSSKSNQSSTFGVPEPEDKSPSKEEEEEFFEPPESLSPPIRVVTPSAPSLDAHPPQQEQTKEVQEPEKPEQHEESVGEEHGEEFDEQPEEKPEEHRPGLGPMVKKKSAKDVAGAFRKAANAYSAFKPRPGGAGERLHAAATKEKMENLNSDEPDGITGVVPAPFLRAINDQKGPPTVETPTPTSEKDIPSSISTPVKEPPTVEITGAQDENVTSREISVDAKEERTRSASRDRSTDGQSARSRSMSPSPSGPRRRRRENETDKYCRSLGIDPRVLDGHGVEFDDVLTDLGWNGRLSDDRKVEDLEADVRREIGRVEATSWLGNLEQQEGKVEQLAKLIDRTLEECDELDGLLTLYSHELNVCCVPFPDVPSDWKVTALLTNSTDSK